MSDKELTTRSVLLVETSVEGHEERKLYPPYYDFQSAKELALKIIQEGFIVNDFGGGLMHILPKYITNIRYIKVKR